MDELALDDEEPSEGPARRLVDDVVLEGVEFVLEPVEDREVAVDDPVDEGPEEEIEAGRQEPFRPPSQADDALRLPVRVVDREEELRSEDDVDLGKVRLAGVEEAEEDDVDEAVGQLQLRPLVPLDDVLGDEGVEAEDRRHLADELGRGAGQIDPSPGGGCGQGGREAGEGSLAGPRLGPVGPPVDDPDRRGGAGARRRLTGCGTARPRRLVRHRHLPCLGAAGRRRGQRPGGRRGP